MDVILVYSIIMVYVIGGVFPISPPIVAMR